MGEERANKYVQELVAAIHGLAGERRQWKPVRDKILSDVFFIRHQHHYVFFREFSKGTLGVISILHENMNVPSRLKEDAKQGGDV